MELETSLVIISYSDCPTTKTGSSFLKDCFMLSNTTRVRIYLDELSAAEGKPATVKMFVGHDTLATAFNSLKFSQKANKFDGVVCICSIQASTVVMAGYLLGSSKTMDDIHWSNHYNNHQNLSATLSQSKNYLLLQQVLKKFKQHQ